MIANTKFLRIRPMLLGVGMIILFTALLIVTSVTKAILLGDAGGSLSYGLIGCLCGILAIWIALRVDRKDMKSIGLFWDHWTVGRFFLGMLTGIGVFMLIILCLALSCNMRLQLNDHINWGNICMLSLTLFFLAWMEELGFRTFGLIKLTRAYGVWVAQFVIALLFAIYHILNGWGVMISFLGPFVWAFVFGFSALWSKGIAMPTGLHLALNIMQNIAGFKNRDAVVFKLVYRLPATKAMDGLQQNVGYGIHAAILLISLGLTFWYSKCRDVKADRHIKRSPGSRSLTCSP